MNEQPRPLPSLLVDGDRLVIGRLVYEIITDAWEITLLFCQA